MSTQISFRVNGNPVEASTAANEPLGLVLRNALGLRGTRMGCEQGNCGACTVVVDGRALQSCDVSAEFVQDKDVTTIDELVNSDPPHPLVEAMLAEDAGQCGFCLAGIIMSVYPLYGKPVERAQLIEALDRNLCRCGAHVRILNALETALRNAS